MYWHKDRHEDQWNKIESPKISPHIFSQLFFDRGAKDTQWEKDSLQQMVLGKLNIYIQKIRLDPYLTLYRKINSKWIKDLTGCKRFKTVKLLEENIGKKTL